MDKKEMEIEKQPESERDGDEAEMRKGDRGGERREKSQRQKEARE